MQAKLIFLNVLAADPVRSSRFYGGLFGADVFAQSLTDKTRAFHMPISSDGVDLNIAGLFQGQPPRIIPFFAVENLRAAVQELTAVGGRHVASFPVDIPDDMFEQFRSKATTSLRKTDPQAQVSNKLGDSTLMLDPDHNPIGLIQLEPFVHAHYRWGKFRQPLTESQVEDHMAAILTAQEVFHVAKSARP